MATKRKATKKGAARAKDLKPRKTAAKSVKGGRPNIYPPSVGGIKIK